MKIYTRTGDKGYTSLFAGGRVPKSHMRVEAYGTVDELNSFIGLIRTRNNDTQVAKWLVEVQNDLFVIGADLATPMDNTPDWLVRLPDGSADKIETWIDTLDKDLEPLKNFILPAGAEIAAWTHVARTVCRRAERICVALQQDEPINEADTRYLNRLSDFLFVLARWFNHQSGISESQWTVRS